LWTKEVGQTEVGRLEQPRKGSSKAFRGWSSVQILLTFSTMAWAYILRGSSGRRYFGSTTDLQRRLQQHQDGYTHSTRRLGTLELEASLELPTLEEARDLERAKTLH
jgi:predicted GIY-YIG superfamily endonuclease